MSLIVKDHISSTAPTVANSITIEAAMGEYKDLTKLDSKVKELQAQGDYLNALKCMERGLILRQDYYGYNSEAVHNATLTTGDFCNTLAMKCLQEQNFSACRNLLRKAEALAADRHVILKITTYNNIACMFRRQGKLRVSLDFLLKAIELQATLESSPDAADTHLNACAVLSQLGKHSDALQHAKAALILLQECAMAESAALRDQKAAQIEEKHKLTDDRIIVLAVAHHNVAVELEYLGKSSQSLLSYHKAAEIAKKHLGPIHAVTVSLTSSMDAADANAAATKKKKSSPKKRGTGASRGGGGSHIVATSSAYRSKLLLPPLPDTTSPPKPQRNSPSRKDVKRFDSAMSAYGRIPGVTPVIYGKVCDSVISKSLAGPRAELDLSTFEDEVLNPGFSPPKTSTTKRLAPIAPMTTTTSETVLDMISPRVPTNDASAVKAQTRPSTAAAVLPTVKKIDKVELPKDPVKAAGIPIEEEEVGDSGEVAKDNEIIIAATTTDESTALEGESNGIVPVVDEASGVTASETELAKVDEQLLKEPIVSKEEGQEAESATESTEPLVETVKEPNTKSKEEEIANEELGKEEEEAEAIANEAEVKQKEDAESVLEGDTSEIEPEENYSKPEQNVEAEVAKEEGGNSKHVDDTVTNEEAVVTEEEEVGSKPIDDTVANDEAGVTEEEGENSKPIDDIIPSEEAEVKAGDSNTKQVGDLVAKAEVMEDNSAATAPIISDTVTTTNVVEEK